MDNIFNELPEDVQAFIMKHRSIIQDDRIRAIKLKHYLKHYNEYSVNKNLAVYELPKTHLGENPKFTILMNAATHQTALEFELTISKENIDYDKDTTYDFAELDKTKGIVSSFRLGFTGSNKLEKHLVGKLKPTHSDKSTLTTKTKITVLWKGYVVYSVPVVLSIEPDTLMERNKIVMKCDSDGQFNVKISRGQTCKDLGPVNVCPSWKNMMVPRGISLDKMYKNKKLATRMKKWNES